MKPFAKTYDDPAVPLRYAMRDDAEVVLATLPWLDIKTACNDFNLVLRLAPEKRHRVAHITLSLPAGHRLQTADWRRVVRHMLESVGLDTERYPVVVARHSGTNCDHVHIVASRISWLGQAATLDLSEKTSAAVHVDLATRLGLPEPDYAVLTPAPRLASRLPARRRAPDVRALHEAVATVLARFRPDTLGDLDHHLRPAGFRIATRDVGGRPLPTILKPDGSPFRRSDLKPGLTSYELLARLAHVKALAAVTGLIRVHLLVRAIDRNVLHRLKGLINAQNTDNADTPSRRGDPAEPHRERDVSRPAVAPSPRPARGGEDRRTVGRIRGPDRNPEIPLYHNDRDGGHGAGDRRQKPSHGARNPFHPGSATDPTRLTYGTWLRHLLSAVRAMGHRAHISFPRIGTARILCDDGMRAILNGRRLRLGAGARISSDLRAFVDALPAGFIIEIGPLNTASASPMIQTYEKSEFQANCGTRPAISVDFGLRTRDHEANPDDTTTADDFRH